MNVELEPCIYQNLKDATTIIKTLDIEPLNVDPSPCGHQKGQQREEAMKIPITRIKIQDIIVIIV